MIEHYHTPQPTISSLNHEAGNISCLAVLLFDISGGFNSLVTDRFPEDGEYLMQDFHSPLHLPIHSVWIGLPNLNRSPL